MDSSTANHNNGNEEDNNTGNSIRNSSNNNRFHVFDRLPPPQSTLPFWNFLSPPPSPSPFLSKQRASHGSTANSPPALNLVLTRRPCDMPSGRRACGSSSGNRYNPYTPGSESMWNQRGRTDHLMSAAPAASSPSSLQPSSPSPPCTECGRRFPSTKALFGHMRCHPEREWRGINRPSNIRRTAPSSSGKADGKEITEDELVVAEALLFLATGVFLKRQKKKHRRSSVQTSARGGTQEEPLAAGGPGRSNSRALGESFGLTTGTSTSGHEEGNARSGGTSIGQHAPAGHKRGNLREGGHGYGQNSASSSSRMSVPDLNFPPPREIAGSGNGN